MCDVDGQWERADVKACESYEFATVRSTVSNVVCVCVRMCACVCVRVCA